MRLLRLLTLCLLLPAALPLCAVMAPLTLTATADREVLLARPMQYLRTLVRGVEPAFDIETAKITLTFSNTTDAPLKLNAYRLQFDRLQLVMSGSDAGSIVQQPVLSNQSMLAPPPVTADFPVLQPGASWTVPVPISFPNGDFHGSHYLLQHTGAYHLHFLNSCLPRPGNQAGEMKAADGAFQGAVASNTLTFTLLEASQPVNGLQIALAAQPESDPMSGTVTLTGYLRNDSDKPIIVHAWNLFHDGLQFSGDDGKVIAFSGGNDRSRTPSLGERYTTLHPGSKLAYPLRGNYRPNLDTLTQQRGDFGVEDPTGFFRNWPVQGGSVHAIALLDIAQADAAADKDAPGPLWTGKVTSPQIVIPLNPTAYRQARLKQGIAKFALELDYAGPKQATPYYSPKFQVQPVIQDAANKFSPILHLDEKQATALIDYLAKSGVLRDASPVEVELAGAIGQLAPPTDGYSMVITGEVLPNQQELAIWSLDLGWDLAMYQRLQALRAQLPERGQAAMDDLLQRLAAPHDSLLAEAALQQPVILDTPAGTLAGTANALRAALHCPSLQVTLDPRNGALPLPALHFCNVTAGEAFQCLAQAANIQYRAKKGMVMLSDGDAK